MLSLKPHFASLRRPWAVWLAVLMSVLGALAPTLSHALARNQTAPAMEVCDGPGSHHQAASSGPADSRDGQGTLSTLNACPFCLLVTDRALPLPHPWSHRFVVSGKHEVPAARPTFFYLSSFTLAAQPRGPPRCQTPVFIA
jgi:hypothetical protein